MSGWSDDSWVEDIADRFAYCFLPAPQNVYYDPKKEAVVTQNSSFFGKIKHIATSAFKATGLLFLLPPATLLSCLNGLRKWTIEWIFPPKIGKIKEITEEELAEALAAHVKKIGFATCTWQDGATGGNNWNQAIDVCSKLPKDHKAHPGHVQGDLSVIKNGCVNYLDDSKKLVQLLQEMGATVFRFNVEWASAQPTEKTFDEEYLQKVENFCKALRDAHIEPRVTIVHVTLPVWLEGGFSNEKNVAHFIRFCEKIVPRLQKYVTHWMTFNEVAVLGFLTEIMKWFPGTTSKAGISSSMVMLRNILVAHCAAFTMMKACNPKLDVSFTHQRMAFLPRTSYNLIERTTCYVLTSITHSCVENFLKTGVLRLPFVMNARLWSKDKPPIDTQCIQIYGPTYFVCGLSKGKSPGLVKQWKIFGDWHFAVGGTTKNPQNKEERISSFGPVCEPEFIGKVLQEARQIPAKVAITEFGQDGWVQSPEEDAPKLDIHFQKEAVKRLFRVLAEQKTELDAACFWTLFGSISSGGKNWGGQIEWVNGRNTIHLGLVDIEIDSKTHKIVSWKLNEAAKFFKDLGTRVRDLQAQKGGKNGLLSMQKRG